MGSTPTTGANLRPYNHQIGLDTQHASPPVDAYVTVDDSLWIMVSAVSTISIVTVVARIILPDGTVVLNQWTAGSANGRIATYTQQRLPEGFILSISATSNNASSAPPTFVALYISRSLPGVFQAAQLLCQGYTYVNQPVSWPGGINVNSTDNSGTMRVFVGTLPGVGININEVVPSSARWRLAAIRFTLTTSGAGGGRVMALTYDNGGLIFAVSETPLIQPISTTWTYNYAVGFAGVVNTGSPVMAQLPTPLILGDGWHIRTAVVNLDAGDQLSAPTYVVEEWLVP